MTDNHEFEKWLRQQFESHCGTTDEEYAEGIEPNYTLWQSELDALIRAIGAKRADAVRAAKKQVMDELSRIVGRHFGRDALRELERELSAAASERKRAKRQ